VFAGALVLFFVAVGLVYASGGFVLDGADVVGVEPTAFGWSMIGVAAFTVLVMVLAALAQLIAWVAAVVDTAELPDKTWFIVLATGHRPGRRRLRGDDRLRGRRTGPQAGERATRSGSTRPLDERIPLPVRQVRPDDGP